MGFSVPSSKRCDNTAPVPYVETSQDRIKSNYGSKCTNTWEDNSNCLLLLHCCPSPRLGCLQQLIQRSNDCRQLEQKPALIREQPEIWSKLCCIWSRKGIMHCLYFLRDCIDAFCINPMAQIDDRGSPKHAFTQTRVPPRCLKSAQDRSSSFTCSSSDGLEAKISSK